MQLPLIEERRTSHKSSVSVSIARGLQDGGRGPEHPPLIADALGEADPVEIFHQFDRDAAPEIGPVAKRRRIEQSTVRIRCKNLRPDRKV